MMNTVRQSFHWSIRVILLAWLAGCSAVTVLGQPSQVTVVSAASSNIKSVAPESIAAAFGENLAAEIVGGPTNPLQTNLAGTSLKVKDSVGMERLAPLYFVSPGHIQFLVPTGTMTGVATVTVSRDGIGVVGTGSVLIEAAVPGLFSANYDGQGVAQGYAIRVRPNGSQVTEDISRIDAAQNRYVAVPIDLTISSDQVVLVLLGTGLRFRSSLTGVSAKIGGVSADVQFAGKEPGLPGDIGRDQVNILLPSSLNGRGEVEIELLVDGKKANTVTITIAIPNLVPSLTSLSPNSMTAGGPGFTLTVNGTNFVSGSVVRWNGGNRSTTFVSSTRLTAQILASDITAAGTAQVTVFNPGPGGGPSSSLTFTINPNCNYTIQPTNQSFNSSGGTGSVAVTTAIGCTWTANSNESWITITSGASGNGNGTVNFSIAANTSTTQRTGTMTIAGRTFTVTQSGGTPNALAIVSAASSTAPVATDSIAAAYGTGLAGQVMVASTIPLPTTLAGTTLTLTDSAGVARLSPLFFVSPGQINFQVPLGTASGNAIATVRKDGNVVSTGNVQIQMVAPGLFSANGNGRGVVSGYALRVRPNGSQVSEAISRFDAAQNMAVAIPIDLTISSDQVFLVLYGTGFRSSSLAGVSATIGGEPVTVSFAGAAPGFIGTDQVNILLPLGLRGRGEVNIVLLVGSVPANTVTVTIK